MVIRLHLLFLLHGLLKIQIWFYFTYFILQIGVFMWLVSVSEYCLMCILD